MRSFNSIFNNVIDYTSKETKQHKVKHLPERVLKHWASYLVTVLEVLCRLPDCFTQVLKELCEREAVDYHLNI